MVFNPTNELVDEYNAGKSCSERFPYGWTNITVDNLSYEDAVKFVQSTTPDQQYPNPNYTVELAT